MVHFVRNAVKPAFLSTKRSEQGCLPYWIRQEISDKASPLRSERKYSSSFHFLNLVNLFFLWYNISILFDKKENKIMSEKKQKDIVPSLTEVFQSFNISAEKLSIAYSELEKKLETVNQELEDANTRLSQSLKEKEQLHDYLASILESMNAGVVAVDLTGKITIFNRVAESLTGVNAPSALGKAYQEVFVENQVLLSALNTHEDGEASIHSEGKAEPIDVDIGVELVKDREGSVLGTLLIINDISERKGLLTQLQRANTLAALGKMAAEVAHELRNPLGAIKLYAEMLQQDLDGEMQKLAYNVICGVNSLETITSNLLTVARTTKPNFQEINLADVLNDVIAFTIYALEEKDIQLETDYDDETLNCYADFEQLNQVLLNLVLNAIQAMPQGGKLQLIAKKDAVKERIQLMVADNGCGIPGDLQEKIFTPFWFSLTLCEALNPIGDNV